MWSFSAVEAGEPEESAAEEKEVEEKSGERKAEKIGSNEKESRGDIEAAIVAVVVAAEADLKVERRWRGEEDGGSGDLCNGIAGDAIEFVKLRVDGGDFGGLGVIRAYVIRRLFCLHG